jgi:hypothetical protein
MQVDFGPEIEQHLAFLVDCRGTFADMCGFAICAQGITKPRGNHQKSSIRSHGRANSNESGKS